MIAKERDAKSTSVPWDLIEKLTGRDISNWELGNAQAVVIKLPEREIHPTVAVLNPVVLDAFDVRELSRDDIRQLVTVRSAYELDHGRYVEEALSSQGAVGCALSHYLIWRALSERPEDGAGIIVFEDDAKLLAPYTSTDSLLAFVEPDDEFLLLSSNTFWPTINRVAGTRRQWAGNKVSGTRGYFIRPALARALLDGGAWPINMQVDYYVRNYAYAHSGREMYTISGVVGMSTTLSCLGHSKVRCQAKFRWLTVAAVSLAAMLLLIVIVLSAMIW